MENGSCVEGGPYGETRCWQHHAVWVRFFIRDRKLVQESLGSRGMNINGCHTFKIFICKNKCRPSVVFHLLQNCALICVGRSHKIPVRYLEELNLFGTVLTRYLGHYCLTVFMRAVRP
ncbi:hypothetical protein GOODEAATRI_009452 [Goodea atripinnis]|uniref:Uncharacterized protein n=1 Tax=Goodea atripinnis TaxID=208336 RepID=A0ABV0N989_9TELE